MKKIVLFFIISLICLSFYPQERQQNLICEWKLVDELDCPDFIDLKKDGRYIITNNCSIKVTDTIYHRDIFTVEKGCWKLENDILLFYDRKIRQYSSFHEYHGEEEKLQIKIDFKSKDTLLLFFKENEGFNLEKFETYIRSN